MLENNFVNSIFVGRKKELANLSALLQDTMSGRGETVILSGEPGIGKSCLVQEFLDRSNVADIRVIRGGTAQDSVQPFSLLSGAMEDAGIEPLFTDQEFVRFSSIFAINPAGLLIAQTAAEEGVDSDIFASMLTAVQDFVRDSFQSNGGKKEGLGKLEYGNMKIIIEHGHNLFLTAIFKGSEHPEMQMKVRAALEAIDNEHGDMLANWDGTLKTVEPIQNYIDGLASCKFSVRREMQGIVLENERVRISTVVLENLARLSEEQPILMILEDIHWADESSLFVLDYLARNIYDKKIMILGACRAVGSEVFHSTLERIKMENNASVHDMDRLEREGLGDIIDETFHPNSFTNNFKKDLIERSGGNPLFLLEILRQIYDTGNIDLEDDRYILVNDKFTIPSTIEGLVHNRLLNLDANDLTVAEYASCIGRKFHLDAIRNSEMISTADESLKGLKGFGLINFNNGMGEFTHGIFQDLIYESISKRWKGVYHLSIGQYYEKAYEDDLEDHVYELAKHYSRSRDAGKSLIYSMKAGEMAEMSYAPEQAVDFYQAGLNALSQVKEQTDHSAQVVSERVGDLYRLMGAYEEALEIYSKYLDEVDGIEKARQLRKMGEIHEKRGEMDEAFRFFRGAKDAVDDRYPEEMAQILSSEGSIYFGLGEYDEAMKNYEMAMMNIEKAEGGEMALSLTMRVMGNVHMRKAEYEKARELFRKSLEISDKTNDLQGASKTLNNIGITYGFQGHPDKALEYYMQTLEICHKLGDKLTSGTVLLNIGVEAYKMGNIEVCLHNFEKSLIILKELGKQSSISMVLNNMGVLNMDEGNLEKAEDYFSQSLETLERIHYKNYMAEPLKSLGSLCMETGRLDEAWQYLERGLEIANDCSQKDQICEHLKLQIEYHIIRGERNEAEEACRKLDEIAKELDNDNFKTYTYHMYAKLYDWFEEWDRSIEFFNKSLDIEMDEDEKAVILYDYGIALMRHGKKKEADIKFKEALDIFQKIRKPYWVDKVKKKMG